MKKPDGPRRIVCLTEETTETLYLLGGMVGALSRADALVASLQAGLDQARAAAARLPRRPRVYFEQWNQPPICGIRWLAELIVIADPMEVVRQAPDVMIASWCGKKFNPARVLERPGWDAMPAVRSGRLSEIKSCDILQPGPAALSDGLRQLQRIITCCAQQTPA